MTHQHTLTQARPSTPIAGVAAEHPAPPAIAPKVGSINAGGGGGDYEVSLDAFQGPLDLLLFLIRRAEVDVHDIPVAAITEQYMGYLRQLSRIDIEEAGEFLVMAATLMEIKSRMLAPPQADPEQATTTDESRPSQPADPRADLVRQLLAYKRFRDAASSLEERMTAWESRTATAPMGVPQAPIDQDADSAVEIDDLDLLDLVDAFAKIIETVDLSRVGEHTVKDDETPIEIHAQDLLDRLARDGQIVDAPLPAPTDSAMKLKAMPLASIFSGRTRGEAVGLFLAMLEMMKQQRIVAWQDEHTQGPSGIFVALRPHTEAAAQGTNS